MKRYFSYFCFLWFFISLL